MQQIITSMEVVSEVDLNHSIATIKRLPGEEGYEVILFGESFVPFYRDEVSGNKIRDRENFATIDDAMNWLEEIESLVLQDRTLMTPAAVHAHALVAIKDDRIREVESELSNVKITLEKNAVERRRLEEALASKGG